MPVTKRTVSLAYAAALAALALSGCGGSPVAPGSDVAARPAAEQLADTGAPATTAPDTTADTTARTDVPAAPVAPAPKAIVRRTVTETQPIGFSTRTVDDSTLVKGRKVTRTGGKAGVRTLTYQVTLTDGRQTAKKLITSVVTRRPVTKVVAIGTKPASSSGGCDPNYSGACVPIASDVDCAGGSGNGPAYVSGPVNVIGSDIYDLDRDGDGVACDD